MGSSRRVVLLAFGVVVVGFVAATAVVEYRLAGIDLATSNIAWTRLPSIENLMRARTALRELQQVLGNYVETASSGSGGGHALARVRDARQELDHELEEYHRLTGDTDPEARQRTRDTLAEVDRALNRVLLRLDDRDWPGAQSRLLYDFAPAVAQVDDELLGLLQVHVDAVYRLAGQIANVRTSSVWFSLLLEGTALLLAGVAAWLSLRAVSQYTRSLEASQAHLARRADELEQFASRVAHDVLSPLSTVSIGLDYAERQLRDERTRRMVGRGRASLRRVEQIVDDLLAFARAAAQPEPNAQAQLREVVEGVLDEAREAAADAHIRLRVGALPHSSVACSPGVLTILISNLVRNAIKYMGEVPTRIVDVRASDRGEMIRVEVEDSGSGIASDALGAIWKPYVRATGGRQPGIGLGLATVKRIVDTHGGRVGVRSSVGHGSCFWFELPKIRGRA